VQHGVLKVVYCALTSWKGYITDVPVTLSGSAGLPWKWG